MLIIKYWRTMIPQKKIINSELWIDKQNLIDGQKKLTKSYIMATSFSVQRKYAAL